MHETKRTKIVCTLGPATEDDNVLREIICAGMNVARLNFSHGTHEYHRTNIERVRRISAELGVHVAIMTDTKGPEIRTRLNEGHAPITLSTGEKVRVTTEDVNSAPGLIALDYKALPDEVGPGDIIFIDDGLIGLSVEGVEDKTIHCTVTNGGILGERKGVNVPNVAVGLPSVTEQDKLDIKFSCEMGVDAIAASFVRDAGAVREIRKLCERYGAPEVQIFAKIESPFAVERLKKIVAVSDGVMVARGDLGVEIPTSDVPQVQKDIIRKCNNEYKPVITATQMLDSMIRNPRPTRAEVSDVATAIHDGTDCVMLSGETAAGSYPVEAVKRMAEVCRKTEANLPESIRYHDRNGMRNVSGATGYAAVEAAHLINAKALICPTTSGRTARIMSTLRPHLPIVAATTDDAIRRRVCFYWGVESIHVDEQASFAKTCYNAMKCAKEAGFVETNDVVVITSGDPLTSPLKQDEVTSYTSTNVCMIAEVI